MIPQAHRPLEMSAKTGSPKEVAMHKAAVMSATIATAEARPTPAARVAKAGNIPKATAPRVGKAIGRIAAVAAKVVVGGRVAAEIFGNAISGESAVATVAATGSRVEEVAVADFNPASNIRRNPRHRATPRFLETCRILRALPISRRSMRSPMKFPRVAANRFG